MPLPGRSSLAPVERSPSWATIRQPSCALQKASSRSRCECSEVGRFSSSVEMRIADDEGYRRLACCLSCGRPLEPPLSTRGSLRCLDCRETNAVLDSQLVERFASARHRRLEQRDPRVRIVKAARAPADAARPDADAQPPLLLEAPNRLLRLTLVALMSGGQPQRGGAAGCFVHAGYP